MRNRLSLLTMIATLVAIGVPWLHRRQSKPPAVPAAEAKAHPAAKQTSVSPRKPEPPPAPDLPELSLEQQRTVDGWILQHPDWQSLVRFEPFNDLHQEAFQSLRRDADWKHRLKQAAALARVAQGDSGATPENTAVVFNFDKIFADADTRRLYVSALVAGDRKAVEEIYISRMWAIATEQHFNAGATEAGGLNPIQMTDELRRELKKEFESDKEKTGRDD